MLAAMSDLDVREQVPLAPFTTLGVGGPARWFVEARDESTVSEAIAWARARSTPVHVLGGGSNLVIADHGVDALVLKIGLRGIVMREIPDGAEVTAAAGEPWDEVVAAAVARGWAGLECLSGIPGLVGATPIQNVGAYGQEVSETVTAVRVLDLTSGRISTLGNADCRFAYRDSVFKRDAAGRVVVLAVTYRLHPGAAPVVRYADVARDLSGRGVERPSVADVRATVIAVRRSKSMVLDRNDENGRSCGSFFLNPVIAADALADVEARANDPAMPRWPERDGRVKLSAAWLIERAGFRRGHSAGAVGLSTRHALAIVARDGATAADVVALARQIQATVDARFGVRLTPEPEFWALSS